ncbi:hypothetical protein [Halostagnicola sp. A-GB9-2]|uniref:5-methylcytosine restriction system specificity protein McrC n=1 Tax=Halostagnicola sp. A-GB9-2 TaxID=3048066 RepID=UPI0024BF4F5F|nr:hypothetical protein [Halostagnicola sp. A-GB9-2]MDJ1430554.1 hypothetical protein [Halostagnicola sp. A-GB9-2]
MSSANLPSTLSISEHGSYTHEVEDPDLVAKQLEEAAFESTGPNTFEKRRQSRFDEDNPVVATATIDESSSEVEIEARDHVGITPLTPSSSLEIEPKIDWEQVSNVFFKVRRYKRTFDYHGVPIENFLAEDKDLNDIYLIVAANYIRNLEPIFRRGLIRSFESRRVDAVDAHGRIDIKRSIWNYKSGTPKQHFITKETDYNIPVNSLLHAAGKYLLTLFRQNAPADVHQGYYSIFSDLRDKVEELEERNISSKESEIETYRGITVGMLPPQRGYYGEAIEISKTILSSAMGRPLSGGDEQLTMDYLINMNSLFEDYSQLVLEEQAAKITEQSLDEELDIEILDKPSYSPFNNIRTNIEPDHILQKNGENIAILDTKYYSDGRDPTRNLANRKQMYRYSAVLGIDVMTFICPETKPQSRKIDPSGKVINVISPVDFSTEQYEICVKEYLEEALGASTLQTELAREVQNGRLAMSGLNDTSLSDILENDTFSHPLSGIYYRDVQEYVADTGVSVPSYSYVQRRIGELTNPVYKQIKKQSNANSEWADVVLPIFSTIETDDGEEDCLRFYHLEVVSGEIKQIESETIGIEKWE